MSDIKWNITPAECLSRAGVVFRNKGKWLSVERCPSCHGGEHRDEFTFAVHSEEGHYVCLRSSCGITGNFWSLMEMLGDNPRSHFERGDAQPQKKRYVYGR